MRHFLFAFCGIAWVKLSVALLISQKPRFYGLKTGMKAAIYCESTEPIMNNNVSWHRTIGDQKNRSLVDQRFFMQTLNNHTYYLYLINLMTEDSGIYYCKINDKGWGPGTQLQVFKPIDVRTAVYRSKIKTLLILLQGLLLAVCVAGLIIRNFKWVKREDSVYEEPEQDHIYEGLAIETCSAGIYEDISPYANNAGAEAPWQQD